jgi:predicted nucleotidyltransferase
LRARWKESRSPRDKALNLILLSVKLIITGAIWGEGARGSISST